MVHSPFTEPIQHAGPTTLLACVVRATIVAARAPPQPSPTAAPPRPNLCCPQAARTTRTIPAPLPPTTCQMCERAARIACGVWCEIPNSSDRLTPCSRPNPRSRHIRRSTKHRRSATRDARFTQWRSFPLHSFPVPPNPRSRHTRRCTEHRCSATLEARSSHPTAIIPAPLLPKTEWRHAKSGPAPAAFAPTRSILHPPCAACATPRRSRFTGRLNHDTPRMDAIAARTHILQAWRMHPYTLAR